MEYNIMQAAPTPDNDDQRLRALQRYHILDTAQEDVFDELADLAAYVCDAPIALISLVDHSRQWFKARLGLDKQETARSVSFCAHAILQPNLFIVPDTLNDERFSDNPLVTGPPNIRFYAGAPLFTEEGFGLGTLCVIDNVPRELSLQQQKTLKVLRTHVLKLLELRLKTYELIDANRDLETFSYTISHDLKAPLRTIVGFSDLLVENESSILDEETRSIAHRIHDAGQRMVHMTDDLLFLIRLGRNPLVFEKINLSELATEVMQELSDSEPDRHIEIEIQPDIIVHGDKKLLRIVLENLLGNAWKYTANKKDPKIEFGQEILDGIPMYYVRDNGAGFEMAYARKLFEPFQRLHSDKDYSGTGVGLAIAKRIIKLHGGTIQAEAYADLGATFHFSLARDMNNQVGCAVSGEGS